MRPESVTFIGHFLQYQGATEPAPPRRVQIVHEPGDFVPAESDAGAQFRMVRLSLQGGQAYRVAEAFADLEVVREEDYDWSMVPHHGLREGQSIDEYLRSFREEWLSSQLCPNPRMYEVENSRWAPDAGLGPNLLHLLLLGHDEYVEVLTTAWSWEPGQPVP